MSLKKLIQQIVQEENICGLQRDRSLKHMPESSSENSVTPPQIRK